jgi:hypothetical protein
MGDRFADFHNTFHRYSTLQLLNVHRANEGRQMEMYMQFSTV